MGSAILSGAKDGSKKYGGKEGGKAPQKPIVWGTNPQEVKRRIVSKKPAKERM